MADESSYGKLDDAKNQSHEGDGEQEGHRSVRVNDILDGRSRDYHQRASPHIVRKVFHGYYPPMKPLKMVLDDIRQQHRYDKNDANLVKNLQESRHESVIYRIVDKGKTNGNHDGSNDIGEKSVGRHLLQITTQLLCNHRCSRRTWSDNASENGLHQDKAIPFHVEAKDEAHDNQYENHLEYSHPQMPMNGSKFMEIHLAECDEENQEHEQRQDSIKDWRKEYRSLV